jgi:hypothetical protein
MAGGFELTPATQLEVFTVPFAQVFLAGLVGRTPAVVDCTATSIGTMSQAASSEIFTQSLEELIRVMRTVGTRTVGTIHVHLLLSVVWAFERETLTSEDVEAAFEVVDDIIRDALAVKQDAKLGHVLGLIAERGRPSLGLHRLEKAKRITVAFDVGH